MLEFLGRGSAFADDHNSAFFTDGSDLVLVDCPASSFRKLKRLDLASFANIYILITHTHGDHSSGVGTMLQYTWFAFNKPLTVVAPSEEVKADLLTLLMDIEGCEEEWFRITTADKLKKKWLIGAIPTTHVKPLEGKCFGYHLNIGGENTVYTGDTATLAPFLPLLKKGSRLYTEAAYYKSDVHLHIDEILPVLRELTEQGIDVNLMHLDVGSEIEKAINGTEIKLAKLAEL